MKVRTGLILLDDVEGLGVGCFTICPSCLKSVFTITETEELCRRFPNSDRMIEFLKKRKIRMCCFNLRVGKALITLENVLGEKEVTLKCPQTLKGLESEAKYFEIFVPICNSCSKLIGRNWNECRKEIERNVIWLLENMPVVVRGFWNEKYDPKISLMLCDYMYSLRTSLLQLFM